MPLKKQANLMIVRAAERRIKGTLSTLIELNAIYETPASKIGMVIGSCTRGAISLDIFA